jgi:hypothetical protein
MALPVSYSSDQDQTRRLYTVVLEGTSNGTLRVGSRLSEQHDVNAL